MLSPDGAALTLSDNEIYRDEPQTAWADGKLCGKQVSALKVLA